MEDPLTRLDHPMIQRVLLTLFVVLGITYVIKREFQILEAPLRTDARARTLIELLKQPSFSGKWPILADQGTFLDGWGRPFYYDGYARLLRSAAADGLFHTEDDRLYVVLNESCTEEQSVWVFESLGMGRWLTDLTPPENWIDGARFALVSPQATCFLPRVFGWDGSPDGGDDWINNLILAIR